MVTIGDSSQDYFIAISTAITSSTLRTNAPSGDVVYFYVTKSTLHFINANKITRLAGRRSSSDKRGLSFNRFQVKKGWLIRTQINALTEKILNGGHTLNHAMLYLFAKIPEPGGTGGGAYDASAIYLSFMNRSENTVWHLKGHLKVADVDINADDTGQYPVKFIFTEVLSIT